MGSTFVDKGYLSRCSEKTLQANEKGFFLQFANHVAENAGKHWITNVFGKLQTDNERIRIIFTYEPVKSVVCETFSHVQEIYRNKSAEVSQKRRLDAESFSDKQEVEKALVLSSQSVLRAPLTGIAPTVDDGFTLALAFWTRSSILIKLQKYQNALTDIQAANREGLPEHLKSDVFCKMAICYKGVGNSQKAEISLSIASKLANNDEKIQKLIETIRQTQYIEKHVVDRRQLPVVDTNKHSPYLSASHKITVKNERGGRGKYFVAHERIRTGETLAVEQPYASCLLPDCFSTHCHHCFERLVSPVGCPDCANIAFCKAECRDIAIKTYHKYECHYLDLLIGSGMSILCHTALRIITQNTLKESLAIYRDKTMSKIYDLCTNAHLRMSEDFFQRTLMATFLLRCLQKSGYFEEGEANEDVIPNEEEFCIGEMLLYNLQMLQFNSHELFETRHGPEDRFRNKKFAYIGVAVYPTVALFNHDCYPSVSRHFVGKTIVITATRPLSPGEVVGENYGPIFTKMPLVERQLILSARYWFLCQCQACIQDWPSFSNGLTSSTSRLRCPNHKCTNVFTLPLRKEEFRCPRCNQNISLSKYVSELKAIERNYETVSMLLDEENQTQKAIGILCEAIDTLNRISCPPSYRMHLAQELLRTCLADSGNTYCCPPKQSK